MESTRSLRDYLRDDVRMQLADLRGRKLMIDSEIERLEAVEKSFQALDAYEESFVDRIKREWKAEPLKPADIRDKSQREILVMLARWNRNWLIAQAAIRVMSEAGIFADPANASAQVYTVLRGKDFEKVADGLYRLATPSQADRSAQPSIQPKTGLVDVVASILAEHPSWTRAEVTAELKRRDWDFQGKTPIFSVGIAFANLKKRGVISAALDY